MNLFQPGQRGAPAQGAASGGSGPEAASGSSPQGAASGGSVPGATSDSGGPGAVSGGGVPGAVSGGGVPGAVSGGGKPGAGKGSLTAKTRARRAVRSVTRTVGRLTAGARLHPGFLIVGAQRCGTTSLFKTLSQHPAVLPAVYHKGVHYFDVAYDRGMQWYLGHFPTVRRAEAVRGSLGVSGITGESSPYYMFHPLAPRRIAESLPDVRLLVLLRDPVERAYSAHAHELARGFETEPFERALALEAERIAGQREKMIADPGYNGEHFQHNAYLTRGQYVEQLEHLEAVFGRDRLHVVDSDEFFADPRPAFDAVCDFLGLPRCQEISFGKHNARARSPMPAPLRARLERHFEPYDERLATWWGRVPSWRR